MKYMYNCITRPHMYIMFGHRGIFFKTNFIHEKNMLTHPHKNQSYHPIKIKIRQGWTGFLCKQLSGKVTQDKHKLWPPQFMH